MTGMEPVRDGKGEIVPRADGALPDLGKAGWREIRERQRVRRAVVEREQLSALIRAYRAHNSTKLHDEYKDEIIRRGEDIVAKLEATDNPLVRQGLERNWHSWMNDIERIITSEP